MPGRNDKNRRPAIPQHFIASGMPFRASQMKVKRKTAPLLFFFLINTILFSQHYIITLNNGKQINASSLDRIENNILLLNTIGNHPLSVDINLIKNIEIFKPPTIYRRATQGAIIGGIILGLRTLYLLSDIHFQESSASTFHIGKAWTILGIGISVPIMTIVGSISGATIGASYGIIESVNKSYYMADLSITDKITLIKKLIDQNIAR